MHGLVRTHSPPQYVVHRLSSTAATDRQHRFRLAQIEKGDVVLDPMCGVGTTLIEAAVERPDAFYIGADVDSRQLEACADNLRTAPSIQLLRCDIRSTCPPIR